MVRVGAWSFVVARRPGRARMQRAARRPGAIGRHRRSRRRRFARPRGHGGCAALDRTWRATGSGRPAISPARATARWPTSRHDSVHSARAVKATFDTGNAKGHEAAPLVVGDTMYVVTPFPNILYALDLTQPGAPLKWKYEPKPRAGRAGRRLLRRRQPRRRLRRRHASSSTRSTTRPSRVDAATGKELWTHASSATSTSGETMTMAPLVVKGKVLVGNSGGEFGVRGWLTALDAATGAIAWRAYSTGPDTRRADRPELQAVLRTATAARTSASRRWPPRRVEDRRRHGLGLDLLRSRARTSSTTAPAIPGPWNPEQRPGRQQVDGGHLRARRRHRRGGAGSTSVSPHDLLRLRRRQRERPARPADRRAARARCCVHARAQRLRLRASIARPARCCRPTPFVHVTRRTRRRPEDRPARSTTPEKEPRAGEVVRDICPAAPGAQGLAAVGVLAADRPALHPAQQPLHGLRGRRGELHRRHALRRRQRADVRRARAATAASSPPGIRSRGARRWTIKESFPVWSGALATAGDVVFYGTMDGWFKAVDARTGELLWQFKTGSGIIGQPITYRGPGRQAVRRRALRRRRLGRRHRRRRSRPARRDRRARLRQRHEGPAARHASGRHALRLRAAMRPRRLGSLAAVCLSVVLAPWSRPAARPAEGTAPPA